MQSERHWMIIKSTTIHFELIHSFCTKFLLNFFHLLLDIGHTSIPSVPKMGSIQKHLSNREPDGGRQQNAGTGLHGNSQTSGPIGQPSGAGST
jgi:hypothetical protein